MKGRIELELHEASQLFNPMDPSPFREKDLDRDAEEFIVSWAREYPIRRPLTLAIHLEHMPTRDPTALMQEAVHNYFANRAKLNRTEFGRMMAEGRLSLILGLAFLAGCLAVSNLLLSKVTGRWGGTIQQSLTIAGWVAMSRPVQIYLHDWWPLWRQGQVYGKLSRMSVVVVPKQQEPGLPGSARREPGHFLDLCN
jgi:hypothetical protein